MKVGFIGAGNMAQSLIGGAIAKGFSPSSVMASDPSAVSREAVNQLGVAAAEDNHAVLAFAEVVVLAVKPQVMQSVLEPLNRSKQIADGPLFVSIAAGINCSMLDSWLGGGNAIVRCMPNTPALLKLGATGLFANQAVEEVQKNQADRLLSFVGETIWLSKESDIDTVTALSGSGPAYFFYLLENMIDSAVAMGLDAGAARLLAQQTALGAAQMAKEADVSLEELRRRVTSPGGTTEAAIQSFEAAGLNRIIADAMVAAASRARELEKELG